MKKTSDAVSAIPQARGVAKRWLRGSAKGWPKGGPKGWPKGWLRGAIRVAVWCEESILAYLLAAMTAVAFANVVARRVFASSMPWALELTLNLFLYMVLLGMAYALRNGLHASIDALVVRLPARAKILCASIASLLVMLYAALLAGTGFNIARIFWSNEALRNVGSEEIGIPHWLTYALLAISFAYFLITAMAMAIASTSKHLGWGAKSNAKSGTRNSNKNSIEHIAKKNA